MPARCTTKTFQRFGCHSKSTGVYQRVALVFAPRAVVYLYKNNSDKQREVIPMNVDTTPTTPTTDDKIGAILDLMEGTKLCGVQLGAVLVNPLSNPDIEYSVLCIYPECINGKITTTAKTPVFPVFVPYALAWEMKQRGLLEIIDHDEQNECHRWWVKFAPTRL